MGIRRDARELAVRILYVVDVVSTTVENAWDIIGTSGCSKSAVDYAKYLSDGVLEQLDFLDEKIAAVIKNWEMDRISRVDISIIRLGLFEIFFEEEMPRNVAINEAVELAKYFSSEKAHKFINGILDTASKDK